jgi:hypothetical protein
MTGERPHIADRKDCWFARREERQREVAKKLTMDTVEIQKIGLLISRDVFYFEGAYTMQIVQTQTQSDMANEPLRARQSWNFDGGF